MKIQPYKSEERNTQKSPDPLSLFCILHSKRCRFVYNITKALFEISEPIKEIRFKQRFKCVIHKVR